MQRNCYDNPLVDALSILPPPIAAAAIPVFIGVGTDIGIEAFTNKSDSDIDPDSDAGIDDKYYYSCALPVIHES